MYIPHSFCVLQFILIYEFKLTGPTATFFLLVADEDASQILANNLVTSLFVFLCNRLIPNFGTKRNNRAFKRRFESSLPRGLPANQDVPNIPEEAIAFYCMPPSSVAEA